MKSRLPLPARPARRLLLLLLPLLALGAASCEEALKDLLTFQISDSSTVTLPAAPITGTFSLPGVPVTSTSANTYKNNNTQAEYVQDVTLDELKLTITAPAGQNFDFLKSISISIATNSSGTDKVALAALSDVPRGQTTITLTPAGSKLDAFLLNSSYTLFTTAELVQPLTQSITLRTDARYNVRARQP